MYNYQAGNFENNAVESDVCIRDECYQGHCGYWWSSPHALNMECSGQNGIIGNWWIATSNLVSHT